MGRNGDEMGIDGAIWGEMGMGLENLTNFGLLFEGI